MSKKTNKIVKIGMLAAIGFVLMLIEFPLPMFPTFLQIDLSEVPVLLGAFSMGPMAAVVIELIKNLLHFIFKPQTGGVGELAGFIAGSVFAITVGLCYMKSKTKKNAAIGLAIGTVLMAAAMCIFNYFIMLPLYLGTGITADNLPLIVTAIFPFNILKGIIISAITLMVYKKISPILHK